LKTRKKRKFKIIYLLLIDLAAVLVILVLLLYKPARYDPPRAVHDKQVAPYLTYLSSEIYNGAQLQEPFDLIVTQQGINDAIARSEWPKESDGVSFSAPEVLFVPDQIVLMGTANIKGVEFVVTVMLEPTLDQRGFLNLYVAKIKIGAMNITLLARLIARRMYHQRLATTTIDTDDLRAKTAGSLLDNQPFDPVFKVEDKKVRIKKITIAEQKLTIRFAPAPR